MASRYIVCLLAFLSFLGNPLFSQSESPGALRSAARALSVGALSGIAQGAGKSDAESQVLTGLSLQIVAERIHNDAEGRAATLRLSAYWLRKAAEKGSAPAQYFLAETDLKLLSECGEMSAMLNKAASQNYSPAMTALGRLQMEGGCGFKVNYPLGLQWLRKASGAGEAEANYWIGVSYVQGRGVKTDEGEGNRWFLKGAQMGDPLSQDQIGINLAEGNGTQKSAGEAVDWFRKSAEQGYYGAACNLALHYLRGDGVAKDYVLGLMWGLIADRNAPDIGCLSEMDGREFPQPTHAQEFEATQRANEWLTVHHYPSIAAPK